MRGDMFMHGERNLITMQSEIQGLILVLLFLLKPTQHLYPIWAYKIQEFLNMVRSEVSFLGRLLCGM